MHREFLMGNEAMAVGALAAGVGVVAGYPGTPSTEVLETVARRRPEGVYVEWSVNEKAALEVAAGAAYAGARALVTMKQVGLNVASDPLMSLSYIGVKGGMVVLVADDPGPISSQTEQDTRTFAAYAKLPILDPSSPSEAYAMMCEAFELSEELGCPVIVRPTTRVDHGYEDVLVAGPEEWAHHEAEGFVRDPSRWVIFPALSVRAHAAIRGARRRARRAPLRLREKHRPPDGGTRRAPAPRHRHARHQRHLRRGEPGREGRRAGAPRGDPVPLPGAPRRRLPRRPRRGPLRGGARPRDRACAHRRLRTSWPNGKDSRQAHRRHPAVGREHRRVRSVVPSTHFSVGKLLTSPRRRVLLRAQFRMSRTSQWLVRAKRIV